MGFCFGGRLAFDSGSLGLDLAGAVGFYGVPIGPRNDIPAPVDIAGDLRSPVLGLFGGGMSMMFKRLRPLFRARFELLSNVNGRLTESIVAISISGDSI